MASAPLLKTSAPSAAPSLDQARAALTLALFLGGVVVGVITYRTIDKPAPVTQYASLEKSMVEPRVAAIAVDAIRLDDATALASTMDPNTLKRLSMALRPVPAPIAEIRSIEFKGAVTNRGGRTLAAYVAVIREMSGLEIPVGFVLQVQDDQIVGVN